jgi:hypothetical protein
VQNPPPQIKTIIFSRNRAMQLDATLHSFFNHCLDAASTSVQVLFLATDERHSRQYQRLQQAYPQVGFVPQTHFHQNLETILTADLLDSQQERSYARLGRLNRFRFRPGSLAGRIWKHTFESLQGQIIRRLMPTPRAGSYILFLVDDNLFVRDFSLGAAVQALNASPDALGVSLRLGRNTAYCYAHDHAQRLPEFTAQAGGLLKYNWTTAEYDFAYPLEVSSSVFRAQEIIPLVCGMNFRNPNDLEGYIAAHSGWFKQSFPFLLCTPESVTFCNPINIVQTTTDNRAGKQFYYSIDEMIERFDQGERIDVDHYAGFTPNACHQEVELVFKK